MFEGSKVRPDAWIGISLELWTLVLTWGSDILFCLPVVPTALYLGIWSVRTTLQRLLSCWKRWALESQRTKGTAGEQMRLILKSEIAIY